MIVYNKTTLGIFAIVATLGILTVSTALTLQPAHALSKFFNCTTDVANKTHNLTLEDVNACYNKEFHTSGGPGTETTPTTTHITTTESGEHRGSLHHEDAIRTSIHSPSSSSEGSHRASSHNEGFSSPTTTESGEHRGSLHHHHGTTITSIHSPSSSSEGSHRASSHNEGFSSSSAAAAAASIDELLRGYSGVHSSSSVSGDAAASSSSSSGGASASASATAR